MNDILLDTECSRILVRSELVDKEKLLEGEAITMQCANRDTVLYPSIGSGGVTSGGLEAAVSDTVPRCFTRE